MKAIVVDQAALDSNIQVVVRRAGPRRVYGVLKNNGYGLGLLELAARLVAGGVEAFAVTEPDDVDRLRQAGYSANEILMLHSTCLADEVGQLLAARAVFTVGSLAAGQVLDAAAERAGLTAQAHLEIETGMGRSDFQPSRIDQLASIWRDLTHIHVAGMYTHLAQAFGQPEVSRRQVDQLLGVKAALAQRGCDPGLLHAANSPGLFRFDFALLDAVRIGSAWTGGLVIPGDFGLKRVARLRASIQDTAWLPAGVGIGYGGAYTTKRPTRIGVVPVGYADGYDMTQQSDLHRWRDAARHVYHDLRGPWEPGRLATVEQPDGRRLSLPVLGYVGMTNLVVDLTDGDCQAGDVLDLPIGLIYADRALPRLYQ